jgi:hypothetical protein
LEGKLDSYLEEKEVEDDCVSFVKKWVITSKKEHSLVPTDLSAQSNDELKVIINQLLLQSSEISKENKDLLKQLEQHRRKSEETQSAIETLKHQLEIGANKFDSNQRSNDETTSASPSLTRIPTKVLFLLLVHSIFSFFVFMVFIVCFCL